jgi:flagellum-specific peptidoglycan hydrolase FlgJ
MTPFYFRQNASPKITSKLKKLFKNTPKNSYEFGFIILLAIFVMKNDLSFQFHFNTVKNQTVTSENLESFSILQPISNLFESKKVDDKAENQNFSIISVDENLSNDYSNMTYQNEKNISTLSMPGIAKIKKQQNYVKRFAEVARSEMKKYGIPASITLAQGLIESNAGDSRLSKENNNHFGMKCFSNKCKKGHCSNFTDDSHKDFFRKYETAWESYRAHSIMLGGDRYKHLKKLKKSDYKGWARGLKKAGYATDKNYAKKLIHIIEEMELYQYDD